MNTNTFGTGVEPSEAVVQQVANSKDVDALDLPPLYRTIDPEALDALVESDGSGGTELDIEFVYHGYDVTVTGEGVVRVDAVTDPPRATT